MKEFINELYHMFLFGNQNNIFWFIVNYLIFLYMSVYILTVIHELGHYVVAKIQKRNNVRVSIGKGPSITIGEWTFGLLLTEGKTSYYGELDSILIILGGTIISFIVHIVLLFIPNSYVMLFNILNLINIFGNVAPISFLNNDGYVAMLLLSQKHRNANSQKL